VLDWYRRDRLVNVSHSENCSLVIHHRQTSLFDITQDGKQAGMDGDLARQEGLTGGQDEGQAVSQLATMSGRYSARWSTSLTDPISDHLAALKPSVEAGFWVMGGRHR